MKKHSFLCPHCKHVCLNTDINCPECSRQVRNPPSAGTRQKISPVSWVGLLLILSVIAVFAAVFFMSVYKGKIETGANQPTVVSTDAAGK
jgi:hypothetical protein